MHWVTNNKFRDSKLSLIWSNKGFVCTMYVTVTCLVELKARITIRTSHYPPSTSGGWQTTSGGEKVRVSSGEARQSWETTQLHVPAVQETQGESHPIQYLYRRAPSQNVTFFYHLWRISLWIFDSVANFCLWTSPQHGVTVFSLSLPVYTGRDVVSPVSVQCGGGRCSPHKETGGGSETGSVREGIPRHQTTQTWETTGPYPNFHNRSVS